MTYFTYTLKTEQNESLWAELICNNTIAGIQTKMGLSFTVAYKCVPFST